MGVWKMIVKRTRLCNWIAQPAKLGVQSSYSTVRFTVIFHTRAFSLSHTHIVYKGNWSGELIILLNTIFQIRNLLHCVENLGVTCHLKRPNMVTMRLTARLLRCYDCTCTQKNYDVTLFEYLLWRHNAWMGYEYSLPNLNRPRAIHNHNPHPLETSERVW